MEMENGISIPLFRFSAAPCQLRAVNAIWLTASIQNSSILKWQRERKRKCLPSHFTFLPLKRTQFYDCLSYWRMVIGHIQCPTVLLLTNQFKSLFHPSQSSLPHYDLTGLWLPSWLSVHLLSQWWALNRKVVKMLKGDNLVIFKICNVMGEKKSVDKGSEDEGKLENSHMRGCLLMLPRGFSISEIITYNYTVSRTIP